MVRVFQGGTDGNEELHSAVGEEDGSIVLTGRTHSASTGACHALTIKLDPSGTEVWRWEVRRDGSTHEFQPPGHREFHASPEGPFGYHIVG